MRAGDPRHPPADPRPCRALRPGRADGVVRGHGPASKARARRHVHRCEGRALVPSVAPRRRRIADRRRAQGTGSAPGVRGRASRRSRSMRVSASARASSCIAGTLTISSPGTGCRSWARLGRGPDGVLAVTGLNKWGLALGSACAEMIAMAIADGGAAWPREFDSRRLPRPRAWPTLTERSEDRSPPVRRPAQAGLGRSAGARGGWCRGGRNRATRRLPRRGGQAPRAQRPMHAPRLHSRLQRFGEDLGLPLPRLPLRRRWLGPRGAAVNP